MGLLVALSLLSSAAAVQALPNPQESDYPQPSSLQWHPCGEIEDEISEIYPVPLPIECASLPVPLDYTDENSETLDLSLVRVNATLEPVQGSILFNPGGPGGSGVEYVALSSDSLHAILGGQFNLIGFDPRGTGKTIPFNCNATDAPWDIARRDIVAARNMTEDLFFIWDAMEDASDSCAETMADIGDYLGTPFVARDMIEIVDALGEDGLLHYWGMSYGTFLGATFAAMFPERVGRVLLDSVVNPHEYVDGTWMSCLEDVDKGFFALLSECVDSPDRCPLGRYFGPTTTAHDLLEAIDAELKSLNSSPGGDIVYTSIKLAIHSALYAPRRWPSIADTLQALLNGTATEQPPRAPDPYNEGVHAHEGIKCGDTPWRADSPEDIIDIVVQQSQVSGFSDAWFPYTWVCPTWRFDAKERYTGDFTAKTNYPLLLINGEYDPITPISGAYNTSAGFEGSVVLPHSGYGHGSTSHPSVCTARAIRSYFLDGELPGLGAHCEPDVDAFDLGTPADTSPEGQRQNGRRSLSDEDLKILNAMVELDKLSQPKPGHL
ncbi:hypothetical protein FQN54_008769 [Arachnomyces sp. PD_36]|nr:hypothetical protein FQN54_008769 [Arachnomyces sp. PD_36]